MKLSSLLLVVLVAPVFAFPRGDERSDPGSPPPGIFRALDLTRMYYDQPGNGSLWAVGERYKMSFDAAGATYFPRLDARQPHHLPHRLTPDEVTVGGERLAFVRDAAAVRSGDRIEIERGAFVEAYELEPRSLEQFFVFPSLPRAGDLVVHIPIASGLEGLVDADGLRFRGEHGTVKYSRAVAVDAAGRRTPASTVLEDGAIVIRVDGSVLATAAMPLVIDPVVSDVWVDLSAASARSPDVAWDPATGVWLVVLENDFTASDSDVFAVSFNASGGTGNTLLIDGSDEKWTAPKVANLASAQQFLVVAEVSGTTPRFVRGRTVETPAILAGPQFDVAPQGCTMCGPKILPDVGGDSSSSPTSCYCVVYEEDFPNNDHRIAYRLVTRFSSLVGLGPTYIGSSNGGSNPATAPSISKSNRGHDWLVAWQRDDPLFMEDIWAAYVRNDGSVGHSEFVATPGSTAFDVEPCASSPLDGSGRAMIAFTRVTFFHANFYRDTLVAALDGPNVLQVMNLSRTQNPNDAVDQIEPGIDSDGRHFVVTHSEFVPASQIYDAFASDLFLSGNQIGISEAHVPLHPLGVTQRRSQVSAQHSRIGTSRRYFGVYDMQPSAQNYDIGGQLFDAVEGGAHAPFCAGDGSGAACPCGNDGTAGHGCANSVNPAGALLVAAGAASTANDSLRLDASGMPSTATCLFVQGSSSIAGVAYGDGIRCFSGSLVRLGTKSAVNGAASYPRGSDPTIHARGAVPAVGASRSYQVWYRNPEAFCTSATSNVTNGVSVAWAP